MTAPARILSGDLYDFFTFSDNAVTLFSAEVSDKGMPAALMMAHLQALAHGRTLGLGQISAKSYFSPLSKFWNKQDARRVFI